MKKNNIISAAAIVLFLAGISHLIKIFYEWEMPIWVSFIGGIIPIFLSYKLLKLKK